MYVGEMLVSGVCRLRKLLHVYVCELVSFCRFAWASLGAKEVSRIGEFPQVYVRGLRSFYKCAYASVKDFRGGKN